MIDQQELRRESAAHFRTRQVLLNPEGDITPYGPALSFAEMQTLRQRGEIKTIAGGQLFANLGISLQLIVHHKGRKALVLVQQGDVLKLVSGYVPVEHLDNPLKTAWAELMEEVLPIDGDNRLYGFAVNGEPLDDPYLLQREGLLDVKPADFLVGLESEMLSFNKAESFWPVTSYQHGETASLQLVYPVSVTLPDTITLHHADDMFDPDSDELISRFDPSCCCLLMELTSYSQPTGKVFTLEQGEWLLVDVGKHPLSEFFRVADPKFIA